MKLDPSSQTSSSTLDPTATPRRGRKRAIWQSFALSCPLSQRQIDRSAFPDAAGTSFTAAAHPRKLRGQRLLPIVRADAPFTHLPRKPRLPG